MTVTSQIIHNAAEIVGVDTYTNLGEAIGLAKKCFYYDQNPAQAATKRLQRREKRRSISPYRANRYLDKLMLKSPDNYLDE